MQEKSVDEVIDDINKELNRPIIGAPAIHSLHQRVKEDYNDQYEDESEYEGDYYDYDDYEDEEEDEEEDDDYEEEEDDEDNISFVEIRLEPQIENSLFQTIPRSIMRQHGFWQTAESHLVEQYIVNAGLEISITNAVRATEISLGVPVAHFVKHPVPEIFKGMIEPLENELQKCKNEQTQQGILWLPSLEELLEPTSEILHIPQQKNLWLPIRFEHLLLPEVLPEVEILPKALPAVHQHSIYFLS